MSSCLVRLEEVTRVALSRFEEMWDSVEYCLDFPGYSLLGTSSNQAGEQPK